MREVLLAALLLTATLAGCLGSEEGPSAQRPDWPSGLLLTYEVAANGSTAQETFLVQNGTERGTELWAWNLSRPEFSSALLTWNERYNPDDPLWSGLFEWPIEPGDEYEATVAGVDVTVTWSRVPHEGDFPTDTAVEGVARDADGEEVARFRFTVGRETVLTHAEVHAGRVNETWQLEEADLRPGWRGAPTWTKGDWWTYNGSFRGEEGHSTIVYTGDHEGRRSTQYQLEPVAFDDRVLMVPFQKWRKGDIAPQSGFVNSLLNSFWSWPLSDGKTWTGSTSTVEGASEYLAVATLERRAPLPDGTVSTTFTVEVYAADHEEAFAVYEYAPRVGHLVEWRMGKAGADGLDLNYTLEGWGEAFHGEMQIPHRRSLAEIPVTSGPERLNRSFEMTEEAMWLRIVPGSFAGHRANVDPEFRFQLEDPDGDLVVERNETHFDNRRLDLSGRAEASPGTWNATVALGEGVTVQVFFEALWYEAENRDYRDGADG